MPYIKLVNIKQTVLDGHGALGHNVVDLFFPFRKPTREVHTISGVQNNLYNGNKFLQVGYVLIVQQDMLSIYDAKNKKNAVSRDTIIHYSYHKDTQL